MYSYHQKNYIGTSKAYHDWRNNCQNSDTVYHTIRSIIQEYRHRKQRRRAVLILCFFAMLILMASIVIFSFSRHASYAARQGSSSSKYFKSIEIEKGDTLWSIAQENMDANYYKNVSEYISEIKTVNTLVSDDVKAGNYIIIPYYPDGH